jgi:hypothetical protein
MSADPWETKRVRHMPEAEGLCGWCDAPATDRHGERCDRHAFPEDRRPVTAEQDHTCADCGHPAHMFAPDGVWRCFPCDERAWREDQQ